MAAEPTLADLERQLAEVERRLSWETLAQYKPYPKQITFHAAGADPNVRERLLMAGNQLGKTLSASREAAMHATGEYPDWWPGKRFKKQTYGWAASETSQGTRDTVQRMLLGRTGDIGSGAIPKRSIVEVKKATHGVADAIETIQVRHKCGGTSQIVLKTYDQGRERWQGDSLDWVWFDEEPPYDVYSEGLTRTNATKGVVFMTFTPLKGMSDVVKRYLIDKTIGTHVTSMTIEDALHYTPEERARIISGYRAHERDARTKGIPMLGEGRVFPFEEELLQESRIQIPAYWPRIAGIDFGYDHPTAVAWLAWDRDVDIVHVYDVYRRREASPVVHAATIRTRGDWIPVAWPHDGETRDDRGSGETLANQYRNLGVNMLKARATFAAGPGKTEGQGGNSLEAGVIEMYDRIETGRLRVAKDLEPWFEEFRLYHRKDGMIVRENDDVLSATRMGLMMLRHATVRQVPRRPTVSGYRSTVDGMGVLG